MDVVSLCTAYDYKSPIGQWVSSDREKKKNQQQQPWGIDGPLLRDYNPRCFELPLPADLSNEAAANPLLVVTAVAQLHSNQFSGHDRQRPNACPHYNSTI